MIPARAQARITRSGVERTNHEAIAPLKVMKNKLENRRKKTTVFPQVSWRIFQCTIWFIIYFPEPSTNSNEWRNRLILNQFNINRPETQPFTVKNGLRDLYEWENLLGHEKKKLINKWKNRKVWWDCPSRRPNLPVTDWISFLSRSWF